MAVNDESKNQAVSHGCCWTQFCAVSSAKGLISLSARLLSE